MEQFGYLTGEQRVVEVFMADDWVLYPSVMMTIPSAITMEWWEEIMR
jgi:hypothetical protein